MIRIAIPVVGGRLSLHFGHCDHFVLFTADSETRQVESTEVLPSPPHQPGLLPAWLADQGATVVLAGGMGRRAQDLFTESGIRVVVGCPAVEPEAVAQSFLQGELEAGSNLCDH